MTRPFFAAAIYACACLLVYGTGAHDARPASAMEGARQFVSERGALHRLNSAFDFPAVERAARKLAVYQAMLSVALIAGHSIEAESDYRNPTLISPERRAGLAFFIPGETFRALLSRRLADS
ncbi:MAG: hypothetical protein QOD00_1730 [Blastocatellia bacterium]|nr:hypothetical protein [Blastocatellia bacterium]